MRRSAPCATYAERVCCAERSDGLADPRRPSLRPACSVSVAKLFGANLARCRDTTGLSQEEVGIRADLHRTEISQLERGLRCPRIDTLVKLAAALGLTPAALLAGIVWRPAEIQPGSFHASGEAGP
jgi:DNA-binding XRE family transcriptional regulator